MSTTVEFTRKNRLIGEKREKLFRICVFLSQDEECLRPGDASDFTFLEKLENTVGGHPHFVTSVQSPVSASRLPNQLQGQWFRSYYSSAVAAFVFFCPVTSWLMRRPGR